MKKIKVVDVLKVKSSRVGKEKYFVQFVYANNKKHGFSVKVIRNN